MYGHGLRRLLAPSLLLVALAGFAGCGGDDAARTAEEPAPSESSPSSADPAPADSPACDEVWREGEKLPHGYQGCTDGSGSYVERDALGCSSGQRMVTYQDRYYGVLGGTIHEASASLDEDRDYRHAVRICRA